MRLHHLAFVIIINMIWGLNFIALKYALTDLPPIFTNASRLFLVALVLSPFLKNYKGQLAPILKVATIFGIFHFGLFMYAMSVAEGVSEIAIVNQLSVPFATIFAILMLGEVVHGPRIIGIALSFVGVMVMSLDPRIFAHIEAIIAMGLSALFLGYGTMVLRKLKDIPAMTIQAWIALVGFSGSLILSMTLETGQINSLTNMGPAAISGLLYSVIFASVIGHGGMNYLLRLYEVSVVTPYFTLTPVFGVLAGVLILDEDLGSRMLLGGLLTFIGVVIITLRNQKRKENSVLTTEDC